RQGRVPDYPVDGESDRAAEPERTDAALALSPIVGDADLLIAERGDVAPPIWTLIAIEMQEVEDAAIDEAKVAGIDRKVVVAEPSQDPIEEASHGMKEERLRSRPAHAVDYLETCFPKPDKVEHDLGRVLQITIDLDRGIATGETISCED